MPVVYLQNEKGKYIKHNFWVALCILVYKKEWKAVHFLLDYCDCTEIRISALGCKVKRREEKLDEKRS